MANGDNPDINSRFRHVTDPNLTVFSLSCSGSFLSAGLQTIRFFCSLFKNGNQIIKIDIAALSYMHLVNGESLLLKEIYKSHDIKNNNTARIFSYTNN